MSEPSTAKPRERVASLDRETVRVGMVGAGFMAKPHTLAYADAPVLLARRVPSVDLVRIADVDAEAARRAASVLGWSQAVEDWRTVTRAADIDLVDVVTPNDRHAEIAIDAARNGKHVLCEKPLASTLEDARAMHRAVVDAGVQDFVCFVYRLWPAMTLAKRLITEGELGTLIRVRASYFHDYALDPTMPLSWRLQRSRAGAGSVGDIGSHLFDLVRYLGGEIDRVLARSATIIPVRPLADSNGTGRVDVDDLSDVLLHFSSGATGLIETNWLATGSKMDLSFEVLGHRGAVRFTWRRPMELQFYSELDAVGTRGFRTIIIGPQHEGAESFWPVAGQGLGWGDAFTILVQRVLAALARRRSEDLPTFLDGLRAAEAVDAAIRSAEGGAWVDVPRLALSGRTEPSSDS